MPVSLGDVAALMRRIAGAPDLSSALESLRASLPHCFPPGVRVDLLIDEHGAARPLFSTADIAVSAVDPSIDDWVVQIDRAGYLSVHLLPLEGPKQCLGWLLVAFPTETIDPELISVAAQIASVLTIRLGYERAQEELCAVQTQAAQLRRHLHSTDEVRTRATLAASAAHDIGNLFASVMGYVQLLQQSAPASMNTDLRVVEQAARDGHYLLRRVLSTRLESIDPPGTPSSAVQSVVDDVLRLTEPFREGRPELSITTEIEPLPLVAMHPAELREVLINLVINGIAAMPEGGVLTIRAAADQEAISISVSDTGIGIEREVQGAIFQPIISTRTGSGLGLSGSRAVIEAYGGTLEVESTLGHGATFTISLPIAA